MAAITDLKPIPLTQEDIHLITFALRRLKSTAGLKQLQEDSDNLIKYIERENEIKEDH